MRACSASPCSERTHKKPDTPYLNTLDAHQVYATRIPTEFTPSSGVLYAPIAYSMWHTARVYLNFMHPILWRTTRRVRATHRLNIQITFNMWRLHVWCEKKPNGVKGCGPNMVVWYGNNGLLSKGLYGNLWCGNTSSHNAQCLFE